MVKTKSAGTYQATKRDAERGANHLVGLMTEGQWKIRIWQNLGWHYSVHNEWIAISPRYFNGRLRGFYALLSDRPGTPSGSPSYWTAQGVFKDPNKAVDAVLDRARHFKDRIVQAVTLAEIASKPSRMIK